MSPPFQILPILPCAKWTDDCQGKKDYDGRLLSISTRYWPASYSSKNQPSAKSSIRINWGEPNNDGFGEYTVLREVDIEAPTEAEVKALVEDWVKKQMADIVSRLIAT